VSRKRVVIPERFLPTFAPKTDGVKEIDEYLGCRAPDGVALVMEVM
jgi:hypothetical protein